MPVRRTALLLPFGLKSWLYAVTRAVVCQKPRDVTEFIATYCQKLHEFRREHPGLSIHDLTRLFTEVEEGEAASRKFPGSSGSPQDQKPLVHDDWKEILAEGKLSISSFTRDEISQSYETSHHIQDVDYCEKKVKQSPVVSEDLLMTEMSRSTTSMRSAVFQRSPTPCHAELVKSSVVICAAPPPSDQVIVIHSETLPDTIIFHTKGAVSEPSAGSSSAFIPPTSDQDHGRESFAAGAFADVVIYNKVPSIGDLPHPLSISEDLSSPAVDLDFPQIMHSAGTDQAEAAQKEISETDLSAKAIPCVLSTKIQKEVTDVTEDVSKTRVKWRSATVSPKISFTTVRKQVSDTAVVKLLRPCMPGLSDDSGVDSYVRVTELMTETSEKEAESRVPQNTPVPAGEECIDAVAVSDMTTDSLLAIASSNEQLNDAEIHHECLQLAMEELLEQSLEEHGRQDLGKSLSDVTVTETARSVVSSMIDQLLAQDFLETCARATVTEHMEGIQSDLVEDLPHIHDTEKEVSSVCSAVTEPSVEASLLQWCESSVEDILFKAEMQMEHMVSATGLEYQEDRETSLESPEKEQTLRISPDPFLTEASPVTTESELKMDPSADEQLSDAELLQSCELEHSQHEIPEPILEELESALECTFELVPSTVEQWTDTEIYQQSELEHPQQDINKVPEPILVKHDSVLLTVSRTLTAHDQEITLVIPSYRLSEYKQSCSKQLPELYTEYTLPRKSFRTFKETSLHALPERMDDTEKASFAFHSVFSSGVVRREGEDRSSSKGASLLSMSETFEKEILAPSAGEETVSSPETVRHTAFSDDESARENGQLSTKETSLTYSAEQLPEASSLVASEALGTVDSEVPCSRAEPEMLSEVEMEMEHRLVHQVDSSEAPSESPEKQQTLRVSSEPFVTDKDATATTGAAFDPDLSSDEQLVSAGIHQRSELEIPEQSLQKRDSGVVLLSTSETCEEETSTSSAEEETASSPEAVRHTVDFPDEESAHELVQTEEEVQSSTEKMFPSHSVSETFEEEILPLSAEWETASSPEAVRHTVDFPDEESAHELVQTEEEGQSSTEKMFPSHSDDLAEKPSLVATEALETRDSELQCMRGEPEEIISEAEIEMEHQEDSVEAPLESPKKEDSLIVSLEAFLTDDGMATTGSLFQKFQQLTENEIPQESELKCPQRDIPEPRLDEHDLAAIQPSEVLETFEKEPSTSSSEEKTTSETEGYTVVSSDDGSDFDLLLTEEEEQLSTEKTAPLHSGLFSLSSLGTEKTSEPAVSHEEIKEATKDVTEKHLVSTHLRPHLKKRKSESSQRMEAVEQQPFARTGLDSTDEPRLKRLKSAGALIVKNALAEKNRFMKRLSLSFQLTHKPSAAKDVMTETSPANESVKLEKGREQPFSAGSKPAESQRTNEEPILPEVAQQQHLRVAPTAAGYVSSFDDLAFESSASQVWTLYHVAQASDTRSSSSTTQTSSQSSDAGSELDFETERSSHDAGINLSECQREEAVTSPRFTMAADAEAISIPNYVLMTEREKATGEKSSDLENKAREKDKKPQAKSQKRAPFPGFLSFVLPMDSLGEADWSSQTQVLQMKSSDGKAVYSPGCIRVLYVTNDAPEPSRDSQETPPDSARNMEWTLKISLTREHSTSDTEKGNNPDHK